jgi:hypothetical protein
MMRGTCRKRERERKKEREREKEREMQSFLHILAAPVEMPDICDPVWILWPYTSQSHQTLGVSESSLPKNSMCK